MDEPTGTKETLSFSEVTGTMNIKPKPAEVTITFGPKDYCLVQSLDESLGEWALHYLIDRSYKGKDPDVGSAVLYMNDKEAEIFRKAGFSEYLI